jgi:succinate-semialdehyde dehydrogenase/glutarate-semialdehyde dehydrogenase
VQAPLYEAFCAAFAEKAKSISIGNGLDPRTQMGPLANIRRVEALEALVTDAVAKGARLLTGGKRLQVPGYFYPVTVLAEVPDSARVMREEPFGPLAVINPVASLDEGIEKANALPFGLAAYAFTHSARNANVLAERIQAGNISINTLEASVAETPFGGVKDSGYSREGGIEGLYPYMIVKTLSHKIAI